MDLLLRTMKKRIKIIIVIGMLFVGKKSYYELHWPVTPPLLVMKEKMTIVVINYEKICGNNKMYIWMTILVDGLLHDKMKKGCITGDIN